MTLLQNSAMPLRTMSSVESPVEMTLLQNRVTTPTTPWRVESPVEMTLLQNSSNVVNGMMFVESPVEMTLLQNENLQVPCCSIVESPVEMTLLQNLGANSFLQKDGPLELQCLARIQENAGQQCIFARIHSCYYRIYSLATKPSALDKKRIQTTLLARFLSEKF